MGPAVSNLRTYATAPPRCVLWGVALIVAMSEEVTVEATSGEVTWEVTSKAPGSADSILPEVYGLFYALAAIVFLIAFVVLLRRIIIAWRRRNRPASA